MVIVVPFGRRLQSRFPNELFVHVFDCKHPGRAPERPKNASVNNWLAVEEGWKPIWKTPMTAIEAMTKIYKPRLIGHRCGSGRFVKYRLSEICISGPQIEDKRTSKVFYIPYLFQHRAC